jgi:hypothetical protein
VADDIATVPKRVPSRPRSRVLDRILLTVDGSPASDAAVRTVATAGAVGA